MLNRRKRTSSFKSGRSSIDNAATTRFNTQAENVVARVSKFAPLSYYSIVNEDITDVKDVQKAAVKRISTLESIDEACPETGGQFAYLDVFSDAVEHNLLDDLRSFGMELNDATPDAVLECASSDRLGFHLVKFALAVASRRLDLRVWFVLQESRLFALRLATMMHHLDSRSIRGSDSDLNALKARAKDPMTILWKILEDNHTVPMAFEEIKMVDLDRGDPIRTTVEQQTTQWARSVQGLKVVRNFWKKLDPNVVSAAGIANCIYKISAYRPEASYLINKKLAYLKKGQAYFSRIVLPILIIERFRTLLNESIDHMANAGAQRLQELKSLPQFSEFVRRLPNAVQCDKEADAMRGRQAKPGAEPSTVTAAMIPSLIPRMPFCARRMLDALNREKHLKHNARLQLSLFLKDIKVPVDDQLKYWSTRWDDPQKFEKEHTYTIRYQYGLEGKRQEREMYSCRTMTSNTFPVAGQTLSHGCPYRELKEPLLRKMLDAYGVKKTADIEDICSLAKGHEYQRACQRSFTALHPGHDASGMGNHPVQYYRESCTYAATCSQGQGQGNTG